MNNRDQSVRSRVLVVDDHCISREFTVSALRRAGCTVRQATGVDQACKLALSWLPDLVILDWHLGDGTGLEAARTIRGQWPGNRPSCIVLLTGDSSIANATCLPHPDEHEVFDCILEKPCGADRLVAMLTPAPWRVGEKAPGELSRLKASCHRELTRRLPDIERRLLEARTGEVSAIAHQLTASAGLCGESDLESSLRRLDRACRGRARVEEISDAWQRVTTAASDFLAFGA
ncbi:MAG: response regulator [Xanthomonadales bacterium]|nr:response regulator [Gammaproteobacteria bacterium]MBT8055859.1 response regulator [Gammaproteobacteria bacterium]NNJ78746.1 response regulator [Xanthomonadales bacterium]NNL05131.1 response regulator [Xanthomonadales bacterium]